MLKNVYKKIIEFQNNNKIKYKINPFKLCKNNGWHTISYGDCGIALLDLLKISEDGFSVFDDTNYFIFYNPFYGNDKRVNFTISHEIGHIVLDHHRQTNQQILMYSENTYIENQANVFARNILMPAGTTKELLEVKSINEVADFFEVSNEMAKIRVSNLKSDLKWIERLIIGN